LWAAGKPAPARHGHRHAGRHPTGVKESIMTVRRVAVSNSLFASHPVLRAELLERFPDTRFREEPGAPSETEMIELLRDCDAAIVGMEPMSERVLAGLPDLKVLAKFGIGCDTLDFDALRKHGILFGYRAGTNRLAVAELTLCFMISALRWVTPLNMAMRAGERPRMRLGRSLTGRTVGIHGCGNVGKELVRLLAPFDCTILAYDIADYAEFYRASGVTPVGFDELIERAEVLTLHIPKTAETIGLYDDAVLARLRPDCVLINTCRGGIVDESALYERLASNALVAACFDVFAVEPAPNDALLNLPNFLGTPHIGAATDEARIAMGMAAIEGLTDHAPLREGQYF
jgi:phosphoglycerate dehydrogenase-like enzyme